MNLWRIIGGLLLVALLGLSYLWDRGEKQALRDAAKAVDAHDERVRQMDEMARERD
ncbi:MAG: hypothetical protein HQK87_04060 [Nitrospinae bacterium]|nr:hypothetical protein [Nitrospinota bacterium]